MNDIFKELARQAEFSENDLYTQGDNFQYFAELIVRECAYLLKNSTNDKRLDLSPELFRMLNNISKAQAEYICEHFGVEE